MLWTKCSVYLFSPQTFLQLIDTRVNAIVATVKPALPTIEQRMSPSEYLLLDLPVSNDIHSIRPRQGHYECLCGGQDGPGQEVQHGRVFLKPMHGLFLLC